MLIAGAHLAGIRIRPTRLPRQPPPANADFPFQGEVTGDNVYVRSGAGVNWYPTGKLQRGAVVRVIGPAPQTGWLKIVPPQGSFSLVEATAIERAPGGATGTTKVDQVYVKAGSAISDHKSATQQILPKGIELNILGEHDGFLKIAPPEGSYLYISEQFVRHHGDGPPLAPPASAKPGPAADATKTSDVARDSMQPPSDGAAAQRPAAPRSSPATGDSAVADGAALPAGAMSKYRAMLDSLEAELRNQIASQAGAVNYSNLIDRYRPLAAQSEDKVAQAVAKLRIDQLSARSELERIVTDAKSQHDSTEAFRARLGEDRVRISDTHLPAEMRPWDIKGELLRSAAFNNTRPYRFRVYDPLAQKTVAYVDIPPATGLDSTKFLNQYVGIRVSSQYFSTAAKTNIAVVADMAVLPMPGAATHRDVPPVAETIAEPRPAGSVATAPKTTPSPAATSPAATSPAAALPPPIFPAGGAKTDAAPPPAANARPASPAELLDAETVVAEPVEPGRP
ncbi:MAG: hypothetical protein U1A27_05535 [Phycisphaerae bacterium]